MLEVCRRHLLAPLSSRLLSPGLVGGLAGAASVILWRGSQLCAVIYYWTGTSPSGGDKIALAGLVGGQKRAQATLAPEQQRGRTIN